MATLLETSFSTDENVVVQADVRLLGRTVEFLIVEFDQEKFGEFLSSGSARPKAMREYRKVSMRLALESLQRLLLKWPAPLLTTQKVPLLKRF